MDKLLKDPILLMRAGGKDNLEGYFARVRKQFNIDTFMNADPFGFFLEDRIFGTMLSIGMRSEGINSNSLGSQTSFIGVSESDVAKADSYEIKLVTEVESERVVEKVVEVQVPSENRSSLGLKTFAVVLGGMSACFMFYGYVQANDNRGYARQQIHDYASPLVSGDKITPAEANSALDVVNGVNPFSYQDTRKAVIAAKQRIDALVKKNESKGRK
jgi:hypothetical protein